MSHFCTRCGKELTDGERCFCFWKSFVVKIKALLSGEPDKKKLGLLERDKQIVPDIIQADEGELPIKQYKLAKLRSKIRGHYAEGNLQVTNKRLIFRAPGIAATGKTLIHKEFSINEISGIDVQKGTKLSVLNIIGGLLLTLFISLDFQSLFEKFYHKTEFVSAFFAILLFLGCIAGCILLQKKYWLKLAFCSCGIGCLLGTTGLSFSALDIVFGFKLFTLTNICIFILSIVWFVILLRVCFVPDLVFMIKTTSASEAIQIRRRIWGLFFKQTQEHSGFSEVLPWTDADTVAEELGALIADLKTTGDLAVDKWKEK
ncbi:MAG: hypothetical protein IKB86_05260 [Clostridia bacterium]|nr:hypothetical protein [Clostridia bacterium]